MYHTVGSLNIGCNNLRTAVYGNRARERNTEASIQRFNIAVHQLCGKHVSRNHIALWTTTDDGHHVLAVFEGWFPDDLSQPISTLGAYIAVELPLSGGWCASTVEGQSPPAGELVVGFNEAGDGAQVDLVAYVSCDGVAWRYLRVVVDAEVVWMAGAEP